MRSAEGPESDAAAALPHGSRDKFITVSFSVNSKAKSVGAKNEALKRRNAHCAGSALDRGGKSDSYEGSGLRWIQYCCHDPNHFA